MISVGAGAAALALFLGYFFVRTEGVVKFSIKERKI
jgi:hypothetical protein